MKKLFRFFKGYNWSIIYGIIVKGIETFGDIICPYIMANIIDIGIKNNDVNYIVWWSIVMVAINTIGFFASIICQKQAAIAGQGIGKNIRHSLYKHINTLTHKELDVFGTSTLINRFTNDVSRIDNGIEVFVRQTTRAPIILIGSAICAILIAPKLSIVFAILIPVIVVVEWVVMAKTNKLFDESQKRLDRVALETRENIEGSKVVRAFNKQDYEQTKFHKATKNLYKAQKSVANVSALLNPLSSIVIYLAVIVVLYYSGIQVNVGELSQGKVIAFVDYLLQLGMSLLILARLFVVFTRASASAKRINEIFDTKSEITEKNDKFISPNITEKTPKIEFKNVTFKYGRQSKSAVDKLSFKIMQGQTVGIIGGTGSGKSTIINLIPRYYDTSSGEVLIDGINVKEYSFEQLRGQIGVALQQAVLFKGTIIENMLWRKPNATFDEMRKAMEIAQCVEFVEKFPDKYEHRLTSGGKNLSGGQRQRLTVARALVGDPEILILDDSSSALDYATDAKLRKALRANLPRSTFVVVTQRINTIKDADLIICLDHGKMVGKGKHKELLETCRVYKEIYDSQTK